MIRARESVGATLWDTCAALARMRRAMLGVTVGGALAAAPLTATGAELSDESVSDAVSDELVLDPAVPANEIDAISAGGIVTLSGTVGSLTLKQRAGRIAETVRGVESVVNEIRVSPAERRPASEIREDVEVALDSTPASEAWQVDVQVENEGAVTLTGTVETLRGKALAGELAGDVGGVTRVDNEVRVEPREAVSTAEVKSLIEAALRWDALVDASDIDVSVEDGEVRLAGAVGSAAEARRAIRNAWVAGVTDVDAAGLQVQPARRAVSAATPRAQQVAGGEGEPAQQQGQAEQEQAQQQRQQQAPNREAAQGAAEPPEAVAAAVEAALLGDPVFDAGDVRIIVDGDRVTLRGTVSSLAEKRLAAATARATEGVARVKNRLKVRPVETFSDATLEREVEDALRRNPYVDRYEIVATVIDGVAYLDGTVDSYFEKGRADDITATVEGVVDVNNNLGVADSNEPYAWDPYLDDPYVYDYDWYDYRPSYTSMSDAEIQDEVEDELWWSPFVDSDDIVVDVDNGIVTLEGMVTSWAEWTSARENAYEGGATWVINNLSVLGREPI